MNTNANPLTRREALLGTLKGSVAVALASAVAIPETLSAPPEPAFVPENDYPFFGYEPDTACARE